MAPTRYPPSSLDKGAIRQSHAEVVAPLVGSGGRRRLDSEVERATLCEEGLLRCGRPLAGAVHAQPRDAAGGVGFDDGALLGVAVLAVARADRELDEHTALGGDRR